ncbi:MAG: hypothetical protein AAB323_00775 [Pseudomonadota bacterium]
MYRKRKRAKRDGVTHTLDQLLQKAGKKNLATREAATRMRQAMGFGKQLPGQPETGRLDVTNTRNMADRIADIPFYPHEKPTVDISKIFCNAGHCSHSMSGTTG